MDEATIKALKTLSTYTAGRFDVWALAGDSKKSCRQHVMSELLGAKTPIAKCGVTAIRAEFEKRLGATGDCIAAREGDFIKKARALLAGKTVEVDLSKLPKPDTKTIMKAVKVVDEISKKKPHLFGPDVALNAKVNKSAVDLTPRIIELLEEQKALLRQLNGGRR